MTLLNQIVLFLKAQQSEQSLLYFLLIFSLIPMNSCFYECTIILYSYIRSHSYNTIMAGNTIGKLFSLTTFGESHGKVIGGIIDGCPSGLKVDLDFVQNVWTKCRRFLRPQIRREIDGSRPG